MKMVLNAQLYLPSSHAPLISFPTPHNYADVFSSTINPALASFKKKTSLAVYGEKPLLVKEFHAMGMACVIPVKNAAIMAGFNRLGIEYFNETNFRAGISKDIGFARMGIAGNYRSLSLKGYGSVHYISLEVGSLLKLTTDVFALFDIKGITAGNNNDELNSLNVSGGLVYEVSNEVMLGMNLSKSRGSGGILHIHTRYLPFPKLSLTVGYLTTINCLYIGARFTKGKMSIDLTARYQQVFGFIPTTMLGYDPQ